MSARPVVGDLLLRPVPIGAVVLLVANDRVFKRLWPSWLTGKLSDVAGLVLVPILVIAVIQLLAVLTRRRMMLTTVLVGAAVVVPALAFAVVKMVPAAADAYGFALGWLRAPGRSPVRRVYITHDATDLLAIAGSVVAWLELSRVSRRQRVASHQRPCT